MFKNAFRFSNNCCPSFLPFHIAHTSVSRNNSSKVALAGDANAFMDVVFVLVQLSTAAAIGRGGGANGLWNLKNLKFARKSNNTYDICIVL